MSAEKMKRQDVIAVLNYAREDKISAIKRIREALPSMGLKEAADLMQLPPANLRRELLARSESSDVCPECAGTGRIDR